jgi:hypothetical protein
LNDDWNRKFQLPYLSAQDYEYGDTSEVVYYHPGVSTHCSRCYLDKAVVSAFDEETVPLVLSEKQTKKLDLIKEVKRCHDKQQSISERSRTFGLNRKKVHNDVHGALPSFTRNRTSNLDRYRETITIEIREKMRIKTMYERLVKEGIEITYDNLRYDVKKVKSKM